MEHSALLWVTKLQQSWKNTLWDFPDGPGVKNLPCAAGSIPDQGTKIPHVMEQLSPRHS